MSHTLPQTLYIHYQQPYRRQIFLLSPNYRCDLERLTNLFKGHQAIIGQTPGSCSYNLVLLY